MGNIGLLLFNYFNKGQKQLLFFWVQCSLDIAQPSVPHVSSQCANSVSCEFDNSCALFTTAMLLHSPKTCSGALPQGPVWEMINPPDTDRPHVEVLRV